MTQKRLHEQSFKVIKYLVNKQVTDSKCKEELISFKIQTTYLKIITEFFKIDMDKLEDINREANKDTLDPDFHLIVEYDDRYFAQCKYTRAELYEEQKRILSIIQNGSLDISKDLDSKIDEKEIDLMLRDAYQMKLVKRERTGMIIINPHHKIPIYRYFT